MIKTTKRKLIAAALGIAALGLVARIACPVTFSTNFVRLVLGESNLFSDPSPTADIVLQNDETISNYTDGTVAVGVAATGSLNVTTGNLKVGNGNPSTTLAGEQLYCEGAAEFDASINLDGYLDIDVTNDTIYAADIVQSGTGGGLYVKSSGAGNVASFLHDTTAVFTIADGGGISTTLNLDSNLDLDTSSASAYAADIVQSATGGGLKVTNSGTGNLIALLDGASTILSIADGGDIVITKGINGDGGDTISGLKLAVADKVAEATFTADDTGKLWTNEGASGTVIMNLPAVADGLQYFVAVVAAATVEVNPVDADQILTLTDSDADSIQNTGTVGSWVRLTGACAAGWIAEASGTWSDID